VYRTGQRFGAAHMIDVLRGADTAKVRQFGHQSVSTYGIGGDLDARQWRGVFRQLVSAGVLEADLEGHGALRLTTEATPLLRGERRLQLRADAPARERRRKGSSKATPTAAPAIDLPADAAARFAVLREWRAGIAREQNVPAYVIFHDATLRSIALQQPRDLDALAGIGGVGAGKLERYGREVIATLDAV
jgi:ATP-dependent DNA helicase RecQ